VGAGALLKTSRCWQRLAAREVLSSSRQVALTICLVLHGKHHMPSMLLHAWFNNGAVIWSNRDRAVIGDFMFGRTDHFELK
jgi:hypothetical protein